MGAHSRKHILVSPVPWGKDPCGRGTAEKGTANHSYVVYQATGKDAECLEGGGTHANHSTGFLGPKCSQIGAQGFLKAHSLESSSFPSASLPTPATGGHMCHGKT